MIAIHKSHSEFNPYWVKYCEDEKIPYKLVDCYSNDILQQLKDCDALMWHHTQTNPRDLVAAKPILFSLEQAGVKVFPDFNTSWHFDDKLGQKYLLEALGTPLVPTYIFYEKKLALDWAAKTNFPKVFKLRGGAGSSNVRLARTKEDAKRLIRKAFGKGFSNYDALGSLKERWRKWRLGKTSFTDLIKGIIRFVYPPPFVKALGREVGYVYFQEFIPDNNYDIRVIVIGDKAFAIKRMVRKNDFRASGSGDMRYNQQEFSESDIKLAFQIHNTLKTQCTAMDFVYQDNKPLLVEISYGFAPKAYVLCPGYWDSSLKWHEGEFNQYGWMVEEVMKKS